MQRPFAILEEFVRDGLITYAAGARSAVEASRPEPEPVSEPERESWGEPLPDLEDSELFGYAMKDVKALGWSAVPLHNRPPTEIQPQSDEHEALRVLEELLKSGRIGIEQTPEYIEGAVHPRGRLYLADLRSGRFSVQAHLDLHGLNQQEARYALDEFILESVRTGATCIRVIHGRGRHSQAQQPVLKESIQRWLASRRLGRHVVAYTSARLCDGGGGAVYILLRH